MTHVSKTHPHRRQRYPQCPPRALHPADGGRPRRFRAVELPTQHTAAGHRAAARAARTWPGDLHAATYLRASSFPARFRVH